MINPVTVVAPPGVTEVQRALLSPRANDRVTMLDGANAGGVMIWTGSSWIPEAGGSALVAGCINPPRYISFSTSETTAAQTYFIEGVPATPYGEITISITSSGGLTAGVEFRGIYANGMLGPVIIGYGTALADIAVASGVERRQALPIAATNHTATGEYTYRFVDGQTRLEYQDLRITFQPSNAADVISVSGILRAY